MVTFLTHLLGAIIMSVLSNSGECSSCEGPCTGQKLTMQKCCPREQELTQNLRKCQPTTKPNYTGMSDVTRNTNGSHKNSNADTDYQPGDNETALDWLPEDLRYIMPDVVKYGPPTCNDGLFQQLVTSRDENRFQVHPNGSLVLQSNTTQGAVETHDFKPGEFCADTFQDAVGEQQHAILLCPCSRVKCVKKCCPLGKALSCVNDDCNCIAYDQKWDPLHPDLPSPPSDFNVSYEIVINSDLKCNVGYTLSVDSFAGYPFYMIEKFWAKLWNDVNVCGDTILLWYAEPRQGLVRCMRQFPFPNLAFLAHWLHVPEAVLLALVVVTILVVPRRRISVYAYVHDVAMLSHAAALLARSVFWPFFVKNWVTKCEHIPIIIYFCSLAASFWLNVICLNMVLGFWKPLGPQRSGSKATKLLLVSYSAYAWGVPAILTTIAAAMWYAEKVPHGLIRPTFHETRTCFREEEGEGKEATFAYYYGPTAALLIVNALLFSSIVQRVRQLSHNNKILTNKDSGKDKSFRNQRSVMIYVKLLWLMGVVETAVEIVAWAINSNEFYNALALSCIDLLRAAAIFALCCCKKVTLLALRDQLCRCVPRGLRLRLHVRSPTTDTGLGELTSRTSKITSDASSNTDISICGSVDTFPDVK